MKIKSKEQLRTQRLDVTLGELKEELKGTKMIDKKSVTVHTKDAAGDSDAAGAFNSGPMRPDDTQLAAINEYTRSAKTADEVVVIPTLSANTLPDRDDDYFDKDTLKGFAELSAPYGPNGKSFMVGHDYEQLPVGRIFSTDTKTISGATFLTNEVYIPNTEQYKNFIENVDFGVNWAVSVGVMLESQLCSICQAPQYRSWFFGGICETGHVKSAYYDPKETKTDDWGYIIEADPNDKNAVKALGNMHGAKDFYELSQVFLGAQFFAAIDKTPNGGVIKTALKSAGKLVVPVIGLSAKEAEGLPLKHVNSKLVDAISKYDVKRSDDGTASWTDDAGLVWNYAPGDEILCLGKSSSDEADSSTENEIDASTEDANKKGESDGEGQDDSGGSGEGGASADLEGASDDGSGDDGVGEDAEGQPDPEQVGSVGDLTEDDDESGSESDEQEEELSKQAVLDAAKRVDVPAKLLAAVAGDAEGNGLEAVLRVASQEINDLSKQVSDLKSKAVMGDAYLKQLRTDAIDWYVKAHTLQGEKGVDTNSFEKILDACGENLELIKSLTEDQRNMAKDAAPGVRRSSFPTDPNGKPENKSADQSKQEELITPGGGAAIRRIHG